MNSIRVRNTGWILFWACLNGSLGLACDDTEPAKILASESRLKKATDVFWALNKLGYIIAKDTPQVSRHGCQPNEYQAHKEQAKFRISVFDCGDYEKTKEVVEHPKNKKVDSLLRLNNEGGIIQRGPLQIIVRMTHGTAKDANDLLKSLGEM